MAAMEVFEINPFTEKIIISTKLQWHQVNTATARAEKWAIETKTNGDNNEVAILKV